MYGILYLGFRIFHPDVYARSFSVFRAKQYSCTRRQKRKTTRKIIKMFTSYAYVHKTRHVPFSTVQLNTGCFVLSDRLNAVPPRTNTLFQTTYILVFDILPVNASRAFNVALNEHYTVTVLEIGIKSLNIEIWWE